MGGAEEKEGAQNIYARSRRAGRAGSCDVCFLRSAVFAVFCDEEVPPTGRLFAELPSVERQKQKQRGKKKYKMGIMRKMLVLALVPGIRAV